MARWLCTHCGCLYTAGAPCCPQCRATAHEEEDMEKLTSPGSPPGHPPADRVTGVSAATLAAGEGQELHAVEHPADGTLSPPVTQEPAPAPAPEPEPAAEPEPAPAPAPKPAPARAPRKAPGPT